MKNWLPSVPGPAFAMLRRPGRSVSGRGRELAVVLVSGASGSASQRVTALRHESVDHPVEDDVVIETQAGQIDGAAHMHGRDFRVQLDLHGADVRVEIPVVGLALFEFDLRRLGEPCFPVLAALVDFL